MLKLLPSEYFFVLDHPREVGMANLNDVDVLSTYLFIHDLRLK